MKKLAQAMQALWIRDGSPSYRRVASRTNNMISHTTVHSVINGINSPRWSTIHQVATALHARPDELVTLRDLWDEERDTTESLRLPRIKTAVVVRPGDSLIFTVRGRPSGEELDAAYEQLNDMFPDNEITVLAGINVDAVIRGEAAA